MEFHVNLSHPLPDAAAIESALTAIDPSAIVDVDRSARELRVNTWVDAAQLIDLVGQTGYLVAPEEVRQMPSICCGGCSG